MILQVANHVLGSVMCSPGCFSVYRAAAIRDVIPLYSSKVDSSFDFLTKDMGESVAHQDFYSASNLSDALCTKYCLQLYTPSCNLRSSNRNLLVKPYINLNSYGKRAFSVAAPELWNNLPEDIKSANSIDDFKRKLKTFLFKVPMT